MTQPPSHNRPSDSSDAPDREQVLAQAVAEYLDLHAQEQGMDLEQFCGRYPGIAAELRAELEVLSEIDGMLCPEVGPEQPPEEPLPERLSGHRILGSIGTGGMGQVLLAYDEGLGRKVAIKTLSPRYRDNVALRSRFMKEARAMARLSHPNIVHVYNLGQPDEIPHFVMEFIAGAPLIEVARALPLRQKVELIVKVIWAVDFLHKNQIIHRDLKPGNILVGPDLEPKLLDFGLARTTDERAFRLTQTGVIMGTPDYFSPEQARAESTLDARSDVFSLGAVLYELLTGSVPFRAESLTGLIGAICSTDPVLPRRIDDSIPVDLQNICLKALEKQLSDRYASAEEMARDVERFLADETVLASPTSYGRILSGNIERHVRDLDGWRKDGILSWYEFDAFRKLYDRLIDREDAWILEVRRLSLPQITLYLGAWLSVVASVVVLLFPHCGVSGTPAVLLVGCATVPMAWVGLRCWKFGRKRIAVAYLLAFCLMLPTTLLVAVKEWHLLTGYSQGKESLELFARFEMFRTETPSSTTVFHGTTNAQLWWSLLLSLPAYYWLRRATRATVFSLVFAVMAAQLCIVTLLRWGMLEWLDSDPGRVYFRLIPFAVIYFVAAALIERYRCPGDSRYFYPIAVLFTFVSLSGVAAFHEPYAQWLKATLPKTKGQIEYLFIINAAIYLLLQAVTERYGSPQLRTVAKSFRFVIPGHVLTSLLLLGVFASQRWQEALDQADLKHEARFFEILLPIVACAFVFGSVPKQMKNFFVTGLLFLAIGIGRLEQDLYRDRPSWPVSLLVGGILLMIVAANYTPLRLALSRLFKRRH